MTLGELRDRYLAYKRAEGKCSVAGDESNLRRLVAWLGAETPVAAVTAEKIADYSRDRAGQTARLGRTVSPATRNRELATLRHAAPRARVGLRREGPEDQDGARARGAPALPQRGRGRPAARRLPPVAEPPLSPRS